MSITLSIVEVSSPVTTEDIHPLACTVSCTVVYTGNTKA